MRARSRRSASDYFSAALLELFVMGVFVLIAQPQLRQELSDLVEPSVRAASPPQFALPELASPADDMPRVERSSFERFSFEQPHIEQPRIEHAPAPLAAQGGTSAAAAVSNHWPMRTASYAPLDQFESFAVSLADINRDRSAAERAAAAPLKVEPVTGEPVTGEHVGEQRVARYAPTAPATRLTTNDWNIGAAAQSPRPLSGWTSSPPADATYRDSYPPPFGTQSQWK